MVCIPCIVIPIFLYIWHRFLQPLFGKFWNPLSSKEDQKLKDQNDHKEQEEKKLSCPFSSSEASRQLPKNSDANEEVTKKTL